MISGQDNRLWFQELLYNTTHGATANNITRHCNGFNVKRYNRNKTYDKGTKLKRVIVNIQIHRSRHS